MITFFVLARFKLFFALLYPKLCEVANSFVYVSKFVVVVLILRMFSMFSTIIGHETLMMFVVEFIHGFNHRHTVDTKFDH